LWRCQIEQKRPLPITSSQLLTRDLLHNYQMPKEVIASEIQQLIKDVHFHTKSLKVWSDGTKRCLVGAPVVQVVSRATTRHLPTVKTFLQKSPH
jgi:hypothetical protein